MNKLLLLASFLVLAAVPGRSEESWATPEEAARIVAKMRAKVPPFLAIGEHGSVSFGRSDIAYRNMERACREAGPDYVQSGQSYLVQEVFGYEAVQLCAPAVRSADFAYELVIGIDPSHDDGAAFSDWQTKCRAMKGALKGRPHTADGIKGAHYFGICQYKPE